jgi:PAS domain S-box-containing protein
MRSVAWQPLLIITTLLLILTYLWLQSTSPDLQKRNKLQETIRLIELRDAELMRDVLLVRADLLPQYDALTQTGQELVSLSRSLNESIKPVGSIAEQALGKPVAVIARLLRDKQVQVEYFKSDNAMLRNSLTYFTLVSRALSNNPKPNLAAKVGHLWQAMLGFMQTPSADSAQAIQTELDRLSKTRPLLADYQALIAHGQLIVNVLPQLDALLRQLNETAIIAPDNDFQAALRQYSGAVEARAQMYRFLLYLIAVILTGYLLFQFVRLRANALALQRVHANLKTEMTERRQSDIALRESEERLRAMTDSAHEAIISANQFGRIVSWNHGATAMFGYPVDMALDKPFLSLIPSHSTYVAEQMLNTSGEALTPNNTPIELTGMRQDSREFPLELSLSSWSKGAERYMTVIIRDITPRKLMEETARQQEIKLIQANKMTALGTLVAGVAHEINNPNQLILMNAGLLDDAWGDAVEILDDHCQVAGAFSLGGLPYGEMRQALPVLVHDIQDGAIRIERIVKDLKDFARPQEDDKWVLFSLNDVVAQAVRLLGHLIDRETAHFHVDLAMNLGELQGDPQQIEQVVVNLLVNALEALTDRACGVTVATFPLADSQQICLEVRDEGAGIDAAHLEQLCDPFFTTKQATGGTGLGLAITASLVNAHGGSLNFSSALGQGTCARVIFPEAPP